MHDAWADSGEAWAASFAQKQTAREHSEIEKTLQVARDAQARRQQRADNTAVANVNRWMRELPVPILLDLLHSNTEYLKRGDRMYGDDGSVRVANDWLLEHGMNAKTPARRRPKTADEKAMVRALGGCSFSVGSFDKRLVHALDGVEQITDGQARLLPGLVSRYRRQIRLASVEIEHGVNTVLGFDGDLPLGMLPKRLGHLLTEETAERARVARERRVHGRE